MDTLRAVQLVEGDVQGTEDEVIAAWQYLLDSGLVWSLQGSYGRMAQDLINSGVIGAR